ncbi:hypothetical protein CGCSCA1_v001662 [Colletotrichum siamense]|nr:hypothetical protein CGCSCA1_v001662 [Colletotrichum siamense]
MPPVGLKSVYQQYKRDTNIVASWLAITAKSCGYPTDLLSEVATGGEVSASAQTSSTSQSKTKGGKNSKGKKKPKKSGKTADSGEHSGPKKYTVAVAEYIPLAQFISTSKSEKAKVPGVFAIAINRVIRLRKEFSSKLAGIKNKRNPESDMSHNYFIGILEQVRDVLRPLMTPEAKSVETNLSNKFEGLSVDEPSQDFLDALDIEKPKVVYEAEDIMSDTDALFILDLLWKDLINVRGATKAMWINYNEGSVADLTAVAVASNTGFDLARHMIDDVFPVLEAQKNGFYGALKNKHYMLCDLIVSWSLTPGNTDAPELGLRIDDSVDDLFYIGGRESFLNTLSILSEVLPGLQSNKKPIEPVNLDNMKDVIARKGVPKFDRDRDILKHVFEDLAFIDDHLGKKDPSGLIEWPHVIEDNLLRGLREARQTGKIPFYLAFASQVLLDIHHYLGKKISKPKDEMLDIMQKLCDQFSEYYRVLTTLDVFEEFDEYDHEMREVATGCLELQEDPIYMAKLALQKKKKLGSAAKPEKHGFWKRHPIACGLLLYAYRITMYRTGIHSANVSRSILCAMHLYNAVQAEGQLQQPWPDLEAAMALLGPSQFFIGGKVPREMKEYSKSLMMQLGVSATSFMDPSKRRGKTRTKVFQDVYHRLIQLNTPTWMAFYDRYVADYGRTGPGAWRLEDVYEIIPERFHFPAEEDSKTPEKPKKTKANGKAARKPVHPEAMDPASVIIDLSNALEYEAYQVSFPFFVLHAQAFWVLHDLREDIRPFVEDVIGPVANELRKPAMPCHVVEILQACKNHPDPARALFMLRLSADHLERVLTAGLGPGQFWGPPIPGVTWREEGATCTRGEAALMHFRRLGYDLPWKAEPIFEEEEEEEDEDDWVIKFR